MGRFPGGTFSFSDMETYVTDGVAWEALFTTPVKITGEGMTSGGVNIDLFVNFG